MALLLQGIETRQRQVLRGLAKEAGLGYENVKATAALRLWRGSRGQRETQCRCPAEQLEDGLPSDDWLVHVVREAFGLDATTALAAKPPAQPRLPEGTWCSSSWPQDSSFVVEHVFVLWDLDQGRWDEQRIAARLNSVEQLVRQQAPDALPVHIGCLNPRAPNRHFWQGLLAQQAVPNGSPWSRRTSKLEVVAPVGGLVDQAVDLRLQRHVQEKLEHVHTLAAIVLVSHDDGLTRAIATEAKRCAVATLVVRWRMGPAVGAGKRARGEEREPSEADAIPVTEKLFGAIDEVATAAFLSEDGTRVIACLRR